MSDTEYPTEPECVSCGTTDFNNHGKYCSIVPPEPSKFQKPEAVAKVRLRRAYDLCIAGEGHTAEVPGLIMDAMNHLYTHPAIEPTAAREAIRYDVFYGVADNNFRKPICYLDHHFCRDWDEEGGCYGTNLNHGLTWKEARAAVAEFHEAEATRWREMKEDDWS